MGGAPEYFHFYYTLLMTLNVTLALAMLGICICCKRRKFPKNELLGLEGMVKLKNPDEVIVVTATGVASESQADLNHSISESEKRASTAAHRSLPDIPVTDDNGSELYETVAEKQLVNAQNHHDKVMSNLKKQSSISQHSSISQADDSPYSRVKNSPHNYAKVRNTEHPYAQLNAPSTSSAAAAAAAVVSAGNVSGTTGNSSQLTLNDSLHRSSHHSDSMEQLDEAPATQAEIPAASAIAGMVSASQDLPYMTPPIANQHFSGDSQDSSKGYTSISVREPLANILAQQPTKISHRLPPLSRDVNDSHYATVSDDSDETYAAIEDPTGRALAHHPAASADIYTSGSETYAQIQPMQSSNSIVVAVEINSASNPSNLSTAISPAAPSPNAAPLHEHSAANTALTALATAAAGANTNRRPNSEHINCTPVPPPPVDNLRASQKHSRQASSSSNNSSSLGQLLGSPKPEKRQANSPLPPTPKSNTSQTHTATTTASSSNLTSGRNSVISVIELGAGAPAGGASLDGSASTGTEGSPQKKQSHQLKSLSPSKDIEGMYAKVMKKSKFSRHSPTSQDNSPIMSRKYELGVTPIDMAAAALLETHQIAGGGAIRTRSNSYGAKDHGYETIPADTMRGIAAAAAAATTGTGVDQRKSDCYTHLLQRERQQAEGHQHHHSVSYSHTNAKPTTLELSDKHYEIIASAKKNNNNNNSNTNDPGYETLEKPKLQSDGEHEKKSDYDPNYEVLKEPTMTANAATVAAALCDDGYAKVLERKRRQQHASDDANDGYSKVCGDDCEADAEAIIAGYSTIGELKPHNSDAAGQANHNYASIVEAQSLAKDADNEESDHYARIAETPHTPLAATSPASVSVHNSSLASSSSMGINNTATTSTTSTLSSRQTPSSSQYESLTGSETDYEAVAYQQPPAATTTTTTSNTNTSSEQPPYERLQTDYSDATPLNSSALTTPEEHSASSTTATATTTALAMTTATATPLSANGRKATIAIEPSAAADIAHVDDYFQV